MFSKQVLTIKTVLTSQLHHLQNKILPSPLLNSLRKSMLTRVKIPITLGRAGHLVREKAQSSSGPLGFKLPAFPDLPGPRQHKPFVSCR